ncbi:MAG TPA: GAF domain-containing protein [Chloroflexi bacterium]|nr:GAF domain-containing protein [Chloroflexota bacterium]
MMGLYVTLLFISAIILTGLGIYSLRYTNVTRIFAILMIASAFWAIGDGIRLSVSAEAAKFLWAKIRYFGIVLVPTSAFIFVMRYTGRDRWLTPPVFALLFLEPLLILIAVWTNDWHHLYWREFWVEPVAGGMTVWHSVHGPVHLFHVVYSYVLIGVSGIGLVLEFVSLQASRVQIGILSLATLLPFVGNVLSTLELVTFPVDLTPISFLLTGLVVSLGISRFQLFDLIPVARNAVIDSMHGAVIVLSLHDTVIDANQAAQQLAGLSLQKIVGLPISQVIPAWPDWKAHYSDVGETYMEVTLETDSGGKKTWRTYDLHISPLNDNRGQICGRLAVLYDVTARKRAEEGMRAQKRLFEGLVAMARATTKRTSLLDTLQSILNMAVTLTGAEYGHLSLLESRETVMYTSLSASHSLTDDDRIVVQSVLEKEVIEWVLRHRHPIMTEDVRQELQWPDMNRIPYPVRSLLALPIISGSAVLGVLTLFHSQPNYFLDEHLYLLQSSMDQITMAIRNAQMYDEQRHRAIRQTTLYETLRAVGQYLDTGTIAEAAVNEIVQLTHWPAVTVALPDETNTHLVVLAQGGPMASPKGRTYVLAESEDSAVSRAYLAGQVEYVRHVQTEPTEPDVADYCELAVPLRRGERVLGVLNIIGDRPDAFNEDDIQLARSLGEAIALALDNARLYAEIQQYVNDLSTLYTIAQALSRSLIVEDMLSEALNLVLNSLGFQCGLIAMTSWSDGGLYLAAEYGVPPDMSARLCTPDGLAYIFYQQVLERGAVVMVEDIEREDALASFPPALASQTIRLMQYMEFCSCSCVPLLHHDRVMGVLCLFGKEPKLLLPETEALQMAIGRQIATAVTNYRLFQTIDEERGRLYALIEASRDGIVLIGTDERILIVNAMALRLFQVEGNPPDWVGMNIEETLQILEGKFPRTIQLLWAELHRVQSGDLSAGEMEVELGPKTVHLLNLPVMSGETILGRLLVLRDVTEERLIERMREDLIHAMVHDLRNPLTAIYGAISFLGETVSEQLSNTQRQLWEIAQDNAESMLKMVKDILDISRMESRQMPLEYAVISLKDIVMGVLDSQLPLAVLKHIRMQTDIPSTLPMVWGDPHLIERVLQNLVGNAIKFTPEEGKIVVACRLEEEDEGEGGPKVLVTVRDTGGGIPVEIRDRLFEKFVSGGQPGRGSGLGLAFCKMVIESHGERLWVADTSSQGTTMAFTMPLPPSS